MTGLLPLSFAFAAGAMLALVVVDLAPDAWRAGERLRAAGGAVLGGAVMLGCAAWLDVP